MKISIITDSCCDLPIKFVMENNIEIMSLVVNIKGEYIVDDLGKSIKNKDFYRSLREGEITSTACVSTFDYIEAFKRCVKKGEEVIYIAFSEALSGCVNSARIARDIVLEEYKNANIIIIDSKSASLGLGLIVYYAYDLLKKEYSKEDIVGWIEENKLKVNQFFTVDDLNHLMRGGRVSKSAAIVGNVLKVKPLLNVDREGKLTPIGKVRGRKKAIKSLAEIVKERIIDSENQVIGISHGDCIEDAEILKKMILQEHKVKDIIINTIGPVIGSHSGPGTLGVFFLGKEV